MIIAHFNEIPLVKGKIMKTILKIHQRYRKFIDSYLINDI